MYYSHSLQLMTVTWNDLFYNSSDNATDLQVPCIDTRFPGGRVFVCPTAEGCQLRLTCRVPNSLLSMLML